ncbi:type IV pilus biogenesis protein PilM [Halomonas caseinilytica]|uniref:type IV pilus biogenesis protein PilM n=1 Tax=Halomonas caseinilytica TaxID=438744 RepID=UPI0008B3947C|nr:type IV pilus assembly protein PilM [Halomonas caseinilytica]SEM02469.1 type IV pilus assembly protein PilM [Halomonas caseinilytica]
MLHFKTAVKGLIGVDIGSTAVRLVELRCMGGEPRVSGHGVVPLRAGAVIEHRIQDDDAVVDALSRALADISPLGKRACAAVPAEAAIVKTLNLPASLGEDDIESRLQLESDKHIPFPFGEVAFDFQPLGRLDDDADLQSVLLVACRRLAVEQRAELLTRAGLMPVAVDVDTFAVERAMTALGAGFAPPANDTEGMALVDVGADGSAFYILHRGRVVYRHDMALDGRELIEERRIPEDFVASLARQVGRALQLYYTAGRCCVVRRLSLVGRAGMLPGVAECLAEESGMQVTVLNPLDGVRPHPRVDDRSLARDAPELLIARGLAMRGRA